MRTLKKMLLDTPESFRDGLISIYSKNSLHEAKTLEVTSAYFSEIEPKKHKTNNL